jgi:hypothetical protein
VLYGRDLGHFARHMCDLDVDPLSVNADHIELYKGALLKAGTRRHDRAPFGIAGYAA